MATELILPLTAAQSGIWIGQQTSPDSPRYWTGEALWLEGDIRLELFQQAVDHVLRHALTLHMAVVDDSTASYPHAPPPTGACRPAPFMPDRSMPDLSTSNHLGNMAWPEVNEALRALGPTTAPARGQALWQQVLMPCGHRAHAWALWAHHLVLDGYGFALIHAEVANTYARLCAERGPADLSHWHLADVVAEDASYQDSAQRARSEQHWLLHMKGLAASTLAPWPTTTPLPVAGAARRFGTQIDAQDMASWRQAAGQQKAEWVTWLAAGAAKTLATLMDQERVILGWPVMNRLGSQTLSVPCMHMNIVPLVLNGAADTSVSQLAQQLDGALRHMRPHQRYRYEHLRRERRRQAEHGRIFGPVLNLMPFDRSLAMPGLTVSAHTLSAGPVEDLVINLSWCESDVRSPLRVSVEGNPFLYEHDTLERVAQCLQTTWRAAAAGQDDEGQGQSHHRRVLTGAPLSAAPTPQVCGSAVLGQLARRAEEQGDQWAVRCPQQQLGYRALWQAALAHAQTIAACLPPSGGKVMIVMPRHAQTLALILGTWMAGACYIPLDPATPAARRQLIMEDAHPHLVITSAELATALRDEKGVKGHWHVWAPELNSAAVTAATANADGAGATFTLDTACSPQDTAYVIYTSGSTGRPNGVMISHAGLTHFLTAATQTYGMQASDRMLQFAPLHFDASVEELFLPLFNGACVVMRDDGVLESPAQLLRHVGQQGVTVLDLPTAYWHELACALADDAALRAMWPESIRLVIIGGEAAQLHHVKRWRRHMPHGVTLLNTYGPTETTVICSTAVLAGDQAVDISEGIPIGLPLPGLQFVLSQPRLSDAGTASPVMCWHLCVEGPTLAQGYLGNARLTVERFVSGGSEPHETPHARHYRTGDLVSINAQGQLVYQGRVDDELKISGHRIDPAEIESALLSHPDVQAAVVLAHARTGEHKQLAAFVVLRTPEGIALDEAGLRQHLAHRLPAPAVPTRLIALTTLPRNHNNKVDRHALKDLLVSTMSVGKQEPASAIESELERMVAAAWSPLLGRVPLEPCSDFFALGGASLQAIQACSRLSVQLEREVPVSLLFAHPTVTSFAKALSQPVAHHPPTLGSGQELQPLLRIQRGTSPSDPLLLCIHAAEGLSWCYFGLCRHLPGVEIWGIQSPGITGPRSPTYPELIEHYVSLARQVRPHGPYALLGWSSGGGIAHAMAARLQAQGEAVSVLAMMDSYPATIWQGKRDAKAQDALEALLDVVGASVRRADGSTKSEQEMRSALRQPGSPLSLLDEATHERLVDNAVYGMGLYRTAVHSPVDGPLLYFRAAIKNPAAPLDHGWTAYMRGDISVVDVDSNHNGMSQPKPLATIGKALAERLLKGEARNATL